MLEKVFGKPKAVDHTNGHWMSVSDLMAGLMMVFLFIAIAHMKDMGDIAKNYVEIKNSIYEELNNKFKGKKKEWDIEFDEQKLIIRFKSPDVLFKSGKDRVTPEFKSILSEFFPQYVEILRKYETDISEIRIEGHTSSYWEGAKNEMDAYFKNMDLSQRRTRAVLKYCLTLPEIGNNLEWAKKCITANGLSSSKLVLVDGHEDSKASRRVEFRVITKAEDRIDEILKRAK